MARTTARREFLDQVKKGMRPPADPLVTPMEAYRLVMPRDLRIIDAMKSAEVVAKREGRSLRADEPRYMVCGFCLTDGIRYPGQHRCQGLLAALTRRSHRSYDG
jgi:hypothetical protein